MASSGNGVYAEINQIGTVGPIENKTIYKLEDVVLDSFTSL
jgi:hypothetical protein